MDKACLSEAKSFSGLNNQRGVASGSRLTNTGLWQSSLNSILGDASLPVASRWRQTLLISILWYPAVGAARQFLPKGPKRTESYLVISV